MSEQLQLVVSLYFAQIALAEDADKVLAEIGLGRPHHRVLVFVGLSPGLTVGDLLKVLRIKGQSLNPVLGKLIRSNLITQTAGERDRRQRHLYLTKAGVDLLKIAAAPQIERIRRATGKAGRPAVKDFLKVADCLMDESDRQFVAKVTVKPSKTIR